MEYGKQQPLLKISNLLRRAIVFPMLRRAQL
jgi:hypothetical protein